MKRYLETLGLVVAFAVASTALVRAQEKDKTPPTMTPLRVQVVIGRYQGEKKVSSVPYLLSMNAGDRANLRMGTQIPFTIVHGGTDAKPSPDGKPAAPPNPIQYRDVGTNIDCTSKALEDGRFSLSLTVDDSSVFTDEQVGVPKGNPSFRSFRAVNSMVLRNGETGQFTGATDKVTGETVRVDVTLTVLK
jgi:hypothetical protein